MRVASLTKSWTFDAAHQLPNHDGKCRRLHGHTYKVELTVTGEINEATGLPDEGMVIDFGVLSLAWKSELEPLLDHQFLNDTLPPLYHPTTAENIACFIADQFADLLLGRVTVTSVRVWETPTGYAEVRGEWAGGAE
jgi:6-pyruvoyltetrahydropterin/6-carboxytetrahydropterin synthase